MGVETIIKEIDELRKLIEGWRNQEHPPVLEMEQAINRVKRLYERLRFPEEVPKVEITVIEEEEIEEEEIEEEEIEEEEEVVEEEEEIVEEEVIIETEAERKRARRREILALYSDESPTQQQEVVAVSTPATEPKEEIQPTHHATSPLLESLSFNDRLLLSSELFDGEFKKMESFIIALEREPSLDDALIYIAQRYRWSGENEGAKLLYRLLQNRYLS